jgi:hypothetical protein
MLGRRAAGCNSEADARVVLFNHLIGGTLMPVSRPSELPENGGGRWPHTGFRSVQWGDMEVGDTVAPAVDCAPGYQGLPGGLCQCPHYGYV